MAVFIQKRGLYFYICKSERINGKPVAKIVHSLGKDVSNLEKLVDEGKITLPELLDIKQPADVTIQFYLQRQIDKLSTKQPGYCFYKKGICDRLLAVELPLKDYLKKRLESLQRKENELKERESKLAVRESLVKKSRKGIIIDVMEKNNE